MKKARAGLSLSLLSAAAILWPNQKAMGLEVPLTVEEPIGSERALEVVSGGIPFPEGKYRNPAGFGLYDGETEVPVQVSPIVTYPDGSLHWALVSFPAKAAAHERRTYTLKDAPGKAQPANPVVVKESGDVVEVSNGLVAFAVNRAAFNGFEWITYRGKEVFKTAHAGLTANDRGGATKPTHFEFYYRGPVKTSLYIKGAYADQKSPTFAMVVTMNAGESAIHIEHNLRNGGLGVGKIDVASSKLRLGVTGDWKAGGKGQAEVNKLSKGAWAPFGWQEFSGVADLLVFIRHGGQGGWKEEGPLDYISGPDGGEFVVDMAFRKKGLRLDQGTHKITELSLVFGKTASVASLSEPLHARAPCSWYSQNDSMGVGRGFGSLEDETETYKKAGWSKADDPKKRQQIAPAPNFYVNEMSVHADSEADQIQGMTLFYIRTGQRGALDHAAGWQRYYRTWYMYRTDDFTYGKEGRRSGLGNFGGIRTCAGGCHTYGVGIFNYALLTGNIDALEAAFDLAEQCNATDGTYSRAKPGAALAYWGSRGFVRNYLAVARAADVARSKEWDERVTCFINREASAPDRDQRGFLIHGETIFNTAKYIADETKHGSMPEAVEMAAKGGTTVEGKRLKHPTYGSWTLKQSMSWAESMEAQGHLMAYEVLRGNTDAVSQIAADNAMDLSIVRSELGLYYYFDPVQKAVYYKMYFDYPIPGFAPLWKGGKWKERIPNGGTDSHYTKWWPNAMASGYLLTGDRRMRDRTIEMLWWGLSRNYVNAPEVPEGEAPKYSRIEYNYKGDWITTTALAFRVGASPKKDELAPAEITDLKAASAGGGKAAISFTAPKDEGGTVAFYQLKYAEMPIDDYPVDGEYWRKNFRDGQPTVAYWNFAKNVAGEPKPQSPGKTEKFIVDIPAGKKLWFAVRSYDDSHNRSRVSNVIGVEDK